MGSYISEWAPKWGEAGEDLSILDITEDFLVETYPEAYKEQGMMKITALPDGKDFMIEVPRSNTVLSRASHSDKVKNFDLCADPLKISPKIRLAPPLLSGRSNTRLSASSHGQRRRG